MYLFQKFSILVLFVGAVHCFNFGAFFALFTRKGYADAANRNTHIVIKEYNLEPLRKDYNDGKTSNLDYNQTNLYLYYLSHCKVVQLLFHDNKHNFEEKWVCPYFKIEFDYYANGSFAGIYLDEQRGHMVLKTGQFTIKLTGKNTPTVKDNKTYNILSETVIKATTKQHVTMVTNELTEGNQTTADIAQQNFNGKDQKTGQKFVTSVVENLLQVFIDALEDYISKTPSENTLNNKN